MEGDRLREALKEADAVRLNASHGTRIPGPRAASGPNPGRGTGRSIPVFLDLQGPKWRIGPWRRRWNWPTGAKGSSTRRERRCPGIRLGRPLPHPELFEGAEIGQHWLLDDGAITVKIVAKSADQLKARWSSGAR